MAGGLTDCGGNTVQRAHDWIAAALSHPVAEPAVRVWAFSDPAVVLGCSQRATPDMAQRAAAAGTHLSVRQSGGGAVLAGPWLLGASVLLPTQHPLVTASIPQSFRWFGLAHAHWLQSLGIAAHAVTAAAVPEDPALSWACFARLSPWEIEAHGGKIVGLAQARRRNGIVLGSAVLLADPPWALLCEVLGEPRAHAKVLAARTSSCASILGQPVAQEALARSLLRALSGSVCEAESPSASSVRQCDTMLAIDNH